MTRRGSKDDKDAARPTLEEKLARFGGAERLKIYRWTQDDPEAYAGTIGASDEAIANMEEELSQRYGGGKFTVKGFTGGKCVASVVVVIDAKTFPPRESEAERRRREESPQAPPPTLGPMHIAQIVRDEIARAMPQAPRTDPMQQQIINILAARGDNLEKLLLAQLAQPARAGGAAGNLETFAAQLATMREIAPVLLPAAAGATAAAEDMTPGGRIGFAALERMLNRVADRTGDALAGKVAKEIDGETAPATTSSAAPTTTSSAAPATTSSAAPATTSSAAPTPPRTSPPPGAQPLTAEQLERVRARRAAPTVREVSGNRRGG